MHMKKSLYFHMDVEETYLKILFFCFTSSLYFIFGLLGNFAKYFWSCFINNLKNITTTTLAKYIKRLVDTITSTFIIFSSFQCGTLLAYNPNNHPCMCSFRRLLAYQVLLKRTRTDTTIDLS